MKSFITKIDSLFSQFVRIFFVIFTALLLLSAFFATCYALDMTSQQVLTRWDNIAWNLTGIAGFLLFLILMQHIVGKNVKKRLPLLLKLVCAWCVIAGILLILFSKTVPAADAMSVYSAAEHLAYGDTSVIHPTDSYLSYYPQQVGLMAFFEVVIRLWKLLPLSLPAYHIIKCINVFFALVTILFQYRTVHLFWNDLKVSCCYLLLIILNLPFLMYTSFVYGEIPSFAAISAGIYYLICLLSTMNCHPDASNNRTEHYVSSKSVSKTPNNTQKDRSVVMCYFLLSLLFLTLSVMLRKNSLIIIIAVLIIVLLQFIKEKQPFLLLFALLCAVCSLSILPLVQKIYEYRADNTLSSGVPPISYFAMGMQESSRGNGWYNGFNFNTYQENGMDTEAASAISRAAIDERWEYFKAHPDYAANFYLQKYLSQWADGTYACRQATLATFGGRREFFNSMYEGEYSKYFIEYANHYQNLIYLGAFLFCLKEMLIPLRRHKNSSSINSSCFASKNSMNFPLYLGLIAVLGGFLFHMMWEANSRYIFLYSLLLIPYAAYGLANFHIGQFKEAIRSIICSASKKRPSSFK